MTNEGDGIFTIGCDVGSQSVKGLLVSPERPVPGRASVRHPVRYPNDLWAEQDPAEPDPARGDVSDEAYHRYQAVFDPLDPVELGRSAR